jgi:two-component system cell cycle response regulator DivK
VAIAELMERLLTKPIGQDELFGALARRWCRREQPRRNMNESILIVDDNSDNQDLTQILLEGEGFEVRLAEDAETALKTLRTYRPHLILMDIQLPGMDGLELTRRLRQEPALRDVTIVALSASAMKVDEDNARAVGCDGYITKPINTRTFAGAVRAYLQALRHTPSDGDFRGARTT